METRVCKICKEEKNLEEDFYIAKRENGNIYYRRECKKCKQRYESKRVKSLFKFINEYKKKHSCIKCGFSDHRALQFHHPNDDKSEDVSTMCSHGYAKETIIKEINKCDLLCANCHAIEHSNY